MVLVITKQLSLILAKSNSQVEAKELSAVSLTCELETEEETYVCGRDTTFAELEVKISTWSKLLTLPNEGRESAPPYLNLSITSRQ